MTVSTAPHPDPVYPHAGAHTPPGDVAPGTPVAVRGLPEQMVVLYFPADHRGTGCSVLQVLDGDRRWAGELVWNPDPASGCIDSVGVRTDLRRRGIATALWSYARRVCPHLHHDTADELTDDGYWWARAVGGPGAPR